MPALVLIGKHEAECQYFIYSRAIPRIHTPTEEVNTMYGKQKACFYVQKSTVIMHISTLLLLTLILYVHKPIVRTAWVVQDLVILSASLGLTCLAELP